jgi:8-oxo-dGTP pyrophosphatase MutT (NUDIX family)
MIYSEAVAKLESAFALELPGAAAQDTLAPIPRREWPSGSSRARIRSAAGLLLVFPADGHAHIVLTVRADTLGRHSGQISLPGGVVEPGETLEQAALREAHEEIALPLDGVRVIGGLTPIDIAVSGFRLHPIVGVRAERPALAPSDGEVARILEPSVDELFAPSCLRVTERPLDGRMRTIPAFHVGDAQIWGATAMVLAEFLTLLGWRPATAT